jgi:hypothetical protein
MVCEEEAKKCDRVLAALRRDLQTARYTAQRAQRQFDAADPENRLVTDELERRWIQALQRVREVEERIEQHSLSVGAVPSAGGEEFSDLGAQLDAVWHRPDADVRLKKRITRSLIHEVVVDVDTAASEIVLVIHWKGGVHTEVRVRHIGKRIISGRRSSTFQQLEPHARADSSDTATLIR